jgi:hypothetical protein
MNFGCKRLYSIVVLLAFLCLPSVLYSQLSQRYVLSNTVSLKLPFSFIMMDANTLSSKYPPNNKPSEVYTNEEATVNVAFKKRTNTSQRWMYLRKARS